MPMTLWPDIVGYTCLYCGKWATHWYADMPICCTCHLGEVDLAMEAWAIDVNSRFQKDLPLNIHSSLDIADNP